MSFKNNFTLFGSLCPVLLYECTTADTVIFWKSVSLTVPNGMFIVHLDIFMIQKDFLYDVGFVDWQKKYVAKEVWKKSPE